MERKDILKQYFGYDAFRNGQEEIIDAVLSGRDVIDRKSTRLNSSHT